MLGPYARAPEGVVGRVRGRTDHQRLPPGLRAAVPSCGATVMVSCRPVIQLSEAVAGDFVRTLPCVGLAGCVGCRTVEWRAGGG